ncbi:MAG: DNA-binding protein [Deltaproteobacteria bacterium]|nr:DNA-binding protein [Deltaproteobacteria bacterium]
MKTSALAMTLAALTVLVALCSASSARTAVRWRGPGGWGAEEPFCRLYDPNRLETLRGEVLRVQRVTPLNGMSLGIALLLADGKKTIPVHLGPLWSLDHQEIRIAPSDKVEVRGSRVLLRGRPAILAALVIKGERVLRLRDEDGLPVWSGWRRLRTSDEGPRGSGRPAGVIPANP